ncbi:hypothetical protein CAEBREN_11478 [Caenorhabditis brenneri]|uniref:Uncharacterized protein n=1 Tax=Caenorhabditis brenneri TaxID=135651 RepID=G0N334_CAEBE|nr:hypothetical protein CAEBREN_11478 [Caenorhabditis brenneri]
MRSFIVSIIFMAALAVAWPVDLSFSPNTEAPQPPPKHHPVVKRDYDPRTDAPVRVPADPEDADGEDRVKRDYDPRTDAPVRVPVDSEEADGEDRVKRDLSFSPNTEAPQPPPKHHPVVKRDYDPRTDAPVRVPLDSDEVEREDRV